MFYTTIKYVSQPCYRVSLFLTFTCTRGHEQITRLLFRERSRKITFFRFSWNVSFRIVSETAFSNFESALSSFILFFYFFSGTQVSRTSVKNAKSYELKSEIEKFRGIFRSIVYRVQHIVNKRRESMAFDFQTFGRRHENLCLLFTNRWRGETWIYVFSFIRSRGVYFTILSGDVEAYGRATNSPKGTLILSN